MHFEQEMAQISYFDKIKIDFEVLQEMIDETDFTELNEQDIQEKELYFLQEFQKIANNIGKHLGNVENDFDERLWRLMTKKIKWLHKEQWKWCKLSIEVAYDPKVYFDFKWKKNNEEHHFYAKTPSLKDCIKERKQEFWTRKQKRLVEYEQYKKLILEAKKKGKSINIRTSIN